MHVLCNSDKLVRRTLALSPIIHGRAFSQSKHDQIFS